MTKLNNHDIDMVNGKPGILKEKIYAPPGQTGRSRNPSPCYFQRRCGHAVLMGRVEHDWQDRDYVLSWFGEREGEARRAYRKYMTEGIAQGRRPELVGGGMVRSYGGWSAVLSLRKSQERISGDERILGPGDFVEKVLRESEEPLCHRFGLLERNKRIETILNEGCQKGEINLEELRMGSRRGEIPRVRSEIAQRLVSELGMSLAEVARLMGVSTSAISKIMQRSNHKGATSNST